MTVENLNLILPHQRIIVCARVLCIGFIFFSASINHHAAESDNVLLVGGNVWYHFANSPTALILLVSHLYRRIVLFSCKGLTAIVKKTWHFTFCKALLNYPLICLLFAKQIPFNVALKLIFSQVIIFSILTMFYITGLASKTKIQSTNLFNA